MKRISQTVDSLADYNTAKLQLFSTSSTVGFTAIQNKRSRLHFIHIKDWGLKTDHLLVCLTWAETNKQKKKTIKGVTATYLKTTSLSKY